MQIQSNLASTIAMAFDECPSESGQTGIICRIPWSGRPDGWCAARHEMDRLNGLPDTINPHQMLFGINQGGIYEDIRIEHAKRDRESWIWTAMR